MMTSSNAFVIVFVTRARQLNNPRLEAEGCRQCRLEIDCLFPSFPRTRESRFWRFHPTAAWMPARAGMTDFLFA